ncbi:MAG: chromosomal replication initiator protein DnaA [Bacteroidaceae bacterium]|nr:chromosomal replication initiator protein DnaA [Bacteroidaceae bacterium]
MIAGVVSQQQYATWFSPVTFVSFEEEENELVLRVPSHFFYEYLEEHFVELIRSALHRFFGQSVNLRYNVTTDSANSQTTTIAPPAAVEKHPSAAPANQAPTLLQPFDPQLKASYTFDSFVEGATNKLTVSVARAIAKNPERVTFNPLFVYGPSGVGKTHIISAVGNEINRAFPNKRVLYVSAHLFQVQYTDSVRRNTINDFIHFYQTIQVLIIDDVQEFTTKATQLAFFHIFNHLHQNGCQIILASDRPPVALEGFEERLLTRFKWGLIAEMERPDVALRRDILLSKIRRDGLQIPQEVVDYIAENVESSVRDLEGILNSLLATSIVMDSDVDIEMARRTIERNMGRTKKKSLTVSDILNCTASYFDIDEADIRSASRKAPVVNARQVAMYLASRHTDLSTSKIGVAIGRRNHATVIHSCQQVSDRISADASYREKVAELESILLKN